MKTFLQVEPKRKSNGAKGRMLLFLVAVVTIAFFGILKSASASMDIEAFKGLSITASNFGGIFHANAPITVSGTEYWDYYITDVNSETQYNAILVNTNGVYAGGNGQVIYYTADSNNVYVLAYNPIFDPNSPNGYASTSQGNNCAPSNSGTETCYMMGENGVSSVPYSSQSFMLTDNCETSPWNTGEYLEPMEYLKCGSWQPDCSPVLAASSVCGGGVIPKLTINIDPIEGGNVTGSGISCNVDTSSICQYTLSQVNQASLQANANCNYAFGGWAEKENPHAVTPDSNTTITAKFFKTFPRNTATAGFKQSSGYYGQCLEYVKYETELPDDVCTYSAVNCLGQAASKGYATGRKPKAGAIVIYAQTGTLVNGHAAIVNNPDVGDGNMSIHDANWNNPTDGIVRDRTVSVNDTNIMGYIYPTP